MKNRGFIALTSVLIIGIILIALVVGAAASGIYARFDAIEREYKAESEALAEGCVGFVRMRLATDATYDGNETLQVNGNDCVVGKASDVSGAKSFIVSVNYRNAITVRAFTISDTDLSVVSNQEIPNSPE